MPGVLVTDFCAADHGIDCITQKCLVHLLCELHTLRDEATAAAKDVIVHTSASSLGVGLFVA